MKCVTVGLFTLLFAGMAVCGELTFTVNFSASDLKFGQSNGFDIVTLPGSVPAIDLGKPALPVICRTYSIPNGAIITGTEIVQAQTQVLPGSYTIVPAQYAIIDSALPWVAPDSVVYNSSVEYPENIVDPAQTGNMNGYSLADICIRPLRFIPSQHQLVLYTVITFKLTYEQGIIKSIASVNQKNIFERLTTDIVSNPGDLPANAPALAKGGGSLPNGEYDYVIITQPLMDTVFERFAIWKQQTSGLLTKVVTVDYINTLYYTGDQCWRIRDFIRDAKNQWGAAYVLLGGSGDPNNSGQNIIPTRIVYTSYNYVPLCDLYYADLDGTWDSNNNGIYGEVTDSVDMHPDIFVGRAPVYTISQAQNFISKVINYSTNSSRKNCLLIGDNMNELYPQFYDSTGYITNSAIANNFPNNWQISSLYQKNNTLTSSRFLDSLSQGFEFCHVSSHGCPRGFVLKQLINGSDTLLNSNEIDNSPNGLVNGVIVSDACLIGDWISNDCEDCFTEHLLNKGNGGFCAAITNSSVGLGAGSRIGPSGELDTTFFNIIWNNDACKNIGVAFNQAKNRWISYAKTPDHGTFSDLRHCLYSWDLFGDPAMELHTAHKTLVLNSPTTGDTLVVGSTQNIQWLCKDESGDTSNISITGYYQINDDGYWRQIEGFSSVNDCHEPWTVPATVTDKCILRIDAQFSDHTAKTVMTSYLRIVRGTLSVGIQNLIPDGDRYNIGSIYIDNVEQPLPYNNVLRWDQTYNVKVNRTIYYPENSGNAYHFMTWNDGNGGTLLGAFNDTVSRDIFPNGPTTYTAYYKHDVNLGGSYSVGSGICLVSWDWGVLPPAFVRYSLYHMIPAKSNVPTYECIYSGTNNSYYHRWSLAQGESSSYLVWAYCTNAMRQVGSNSFTIKYPQTVDPVVATSSSSAATSFSNGKKLAIDNTGKLHVVYTSGDSVYYTASADDGNSWATPQAIGFGQNPAIQLKTMVSGKKGNYNNATETPSMCYIRGNSLYNSDNNGTAWSTPQCIYQGQQNEEISYLSYVLDQQRNQSYLGWVSTTPSGSQVSIAPYTPGSQGGQLVPTPIDQGGALYKSPSMTIGKTGNLITAWSRDGMIKYNDGINGTIELSSIDKYSIHPIVSDYGDRTSVVWMERFTPAIKNEPGKYQIVSRERTPEGWKEPKVISYADSGDAQFPMAAANGQYVYCMENGDGNYDISYIGNYGNGWETQAQNISYYSTGQSSYPDVIFCPSWPHHKLYVLWTETTQTKSTISRVKIIQMPVDDIPCFTVYPNIESASPYTTRRTGAFYYGDQQYQIVDYDTSKLSYHFDGLNPKMKYKANAIYFWRTMGSGECGHRDDWQMQLKANKVNLATTWVPETTVVKESQLIPKNCYKDGRVDINIVRQKGTYAICAGLELIAYEDDKGGKDGGSQMEENTTLPMAYHFKLMQSVPNPTTGITCIGYQIAADSRVSLKVYNTLGQVVNTLVDEGKQPGVYKATWNGKDNMGKTVAAGIYFYRLISGDKTDIRKMVVIR